MNSVTCYIISGSIGIWCFFKWANPDNFVVYFRSLSNKHNYFYKKQCNKFTSSIWCYDLNPWPLVHESHPITTRPGHSPNWNMALLLINFPATNVESMQEATQLTMLWHIMEEILSRLSKHPRNCYSQKRLLCREKNRFIYYFGLLLLPALLQCDQIKIAKCL